MAEPAEAPRREHRIIRFEIAPRSILWVLGALGAVWLVGRLWTIVLLVIVTLVIVGTLNPVVSAMERRGLGRVKALLLLFVGLVAGLVGIVLLTIPPLLTQLSQLAQDAPRTREHVITWLEARPLTASLGHSLRSGTRTEDLMAHVSDALIDYSSDALEILGYGITILFLAFYVLADGRRAQGALYAFVPRRYHLRLSRILLNLQVIVGGYMRGQLITSVAIGVFMFVLLTILQVPNALSLAVFASFTDVIPFIGGVLATAPAALMALTRGTGTALLLVGICVVYQEFESRILVPRVYGKVLRLSPASVLLALLIGGTLQGILGALLALPIAAGLMMVVRELRVELPGDDRDASDLRERDEEAEQAFERLAAGTPPEQAAEIATALAREIQQQDADDPAEAAQVPVTSGQDE